MFCPIPEFDCRDRNRHLPQLIACNTLNVVDTDHDKCSIPSSTSGTNQVRLSSGHSPPHRHAATIPRKPRAADAAPRAFACPEIDVTAMFLTHTFCSAASKEELSPGQKLAKVRRQEDKVAKRAVPVCSEIPNQDFTKSREVYHRIP